MKIAQLSVLLCLSVIALGCGQKGPLVLPDAPKHKKTLPRAQPPATPDDTKPPTDATKPL